jgi:hypothetical protein
MGSGAAYWYNIPICFHRSQGLTLQHNIYQVHISNTVIFRALGEDLSHPRQEEGVSPHP